MEPIHFYGEKGPFAGFSNFYPSPIVIDGYRWPTVEHYFQAQKFISPQGTTSPRSIEYAALIASQNTPGKAKILAGQKTAGGYQWRQELNKIINSYTDVKIRPDWESVKDNVMRKAVFNKFLQNPNLWALLNSTGDRYLAEHTTRDSYWGDGGTGTGKNRLGQILMETRTLLRKQKTNLFLIGEPDSTVQFFMDLSPVQVLAPKLIGREIASPIELYNNSYLFVHSRDPSLLIEAIGKGYRSYTYGSEMISFLTSFFEKLYGANTSLSTELASNSVPISTHL